MIFFLFVFLSLSLYLSLCSGRLGEKTKKRNDPTVSNIKRKRLACGRSQLTENKRENQSHLNESAPAFPFYRVFFCSLPSFFQFHFDGIGTHQPVQPESTRVETETQFFKKSVKISKNKHNFQLLKLQKMQSSVIFRRNPSDETLILFVFFFTFLRRKETSVVY